jgi:hypothetical protein
MGNIVVVARVLIAEPNGDVRSLLQLYVLGFGHEPIVHGGGTQPVEEVDVAIVEPGEGDGLELARALRASGVALIFASIFPPETATRVIQPAAHLVKPLPRLALERAIRDALAG